MLAPSPSVASADYRNLYEFAVQNFPSESFSISEGVYAVAIISHEKRIIDVSPVDLHWFKVKQVNASQPLNFTIANKG